VKNFNQSLGHTRDAGGLLGAERIALQAQDH
jgi:hypothetical protein